MSQGGVSVLLQMPSLLHLDIQTGEEENSTNVPSLQNKNPMMEHRTDDLMRLTGIGLTEPVRSRSRGCQRAVTPVGMALRERTVRVWDTKRVTAAAFTRLSSNVPKEQKFRTSAPGLSCQGGNGVQQKKKAVVNGQKVLIKAMKRSESRSSQH